MPFRELKLIEPLLQAVASEGYTIPTAIQKQAIPHVLAGKDLMGCADRDGQDGCVRLADPPAPAREARARPCAHGHPTHVKTGPGSTVGGPRRPIRALVLTPTRELAAQIGESFRVYGRHTGLRHTVVFGGVGQGPQVQALRTGRGHPGRHAGPAAGPDEPAAAEPPARGDLRPGRGRPHVGHGLHPRHPPRDRRTCPTRRQTLMFSATMPREIRRLADTILHDPVEVHVPSESPAADTVEQGLYHVDRLSKPALLEHLLRGPRHHAGAGLHPHQARGRPGRPTSGPQCGIAAEAIHSNKSQNARTRALDELQERRDPRAGRQRHRLPRPGRGRHLARDQLRPAQRAGDLRPPHRPDRPGRRQGQAISFCSDDQRDQLRDIERLLGHSIPVLPHPGKLSAPPPAADNRGAAEAPSAARGGSRDSASPPRDQGRPAGQTALARAATNPILAPPRQAPRTIIVQARTAGAVEGIGHYSLLLRAACCCN